MLGLSDGECEGTKLGLPDGLSLGSIEEVGTPECSVDGPKEGFADGPKLGP